jgi:Flp pilus assembly pilin Flp
MFVSGLELKLLRILGVLHDRKAVTSLEYGILASILGLALVNIFKGFGSTLASLFTKVGSAI